MLNRIAIQSLLMYSVVVLVAIAMLVTSAVLPASAQTVPPPLAQLKSGISAEDITCNHGKVLMQKGATPYCITTGSAEQLQERGFVLVEPAMDLDDPSNTAMDSVIVEPEAPVQEGPITELPAALEPEAPVQEGPVSATIPIDVAMTNNRFAIDFYKIISTDNNNNNNIFYSPLSIHTAYSMLYEGARGNTARQMEQVFGFDPDLPTRHDNIISTMSSLNRDDPHATIKLANSMWIQNNFDVLKPYVDVVSDTYEAGIDNVDFADNSDGVRRINEWASEKTNDRITEIFDPTKNYEHIKMALLNAVYFNGTWIMQFPPIDTREADFWINSSQSIRTDFMHMGVKTFDYAKQDGVEVLRLPYKWDRFSMLIILPTERDGDINNLQDMLSDEMIQKWRNDIAPAMISVSIPKFKFDTSYDLVKTLEPLGITDVYDPDLADLRGIYSSTSENAYVDRALQKAYVDVNEAGTEAAAVTAIAVSVTSMPIVDHVFMADHPFIFVIMDDESGTILFMGRFSHPV